MRASNSGDEAASVYSEVAILTVLPLPEDDVVAPVVELDVSGAGANGWYRSGAMATLSASDAGSGVVSVEYRFGDGGWNNYDSAVTLPEGEYVVQFRATDGAGNTSVVQSADVRVDATVPMVWGWLDEDGRLTSVASDALSGIGRVEYSLNGASWTTSMSGFGDDLVEVQVRAVDVAGNVSDSLHLVASPVPPALTVAPGDVLVIERTGFTAGEQVRVELHPGPIVLGAVPADQVGIALLTATVPSSVTAGAYSLVFVAADGGEITVPVEVIANTGVNLLPAGIAALILFAAGVALLLLRSRRRTVLS